MRRSDDGDVSYYERVVLWQLLHGPVAIEEIADEVLAMKLRDGGPIVRRMVKRGWLELNGDGLHQLTPAGRTVAEEPADVE